VQDQGGRTEDADAAYQQGPPSTFSGCQLASWCCLHLMNACNATQAGMARHSGSRRAHHAHVGSIWGNSCLRLWPSQGHGHGHGHGGHGNAAKKLKAIPIPDINEVETHYRDYLPLFQATLTYLHGKGELNQRQQQWQCAAAAVRSSSRSVQLLGRRL
jgi:hypothetical protein